MYTKVGALLRTILLVSTLMFCTTDISYSQPQKHKQESAAELDTTIPFDSAHSHLGFLEDQLAFGGTLGTPGGLNFIAEGYHDRFGVRLEVGAFPFLFGYQAGCSFVIRRTTRSLLEVTGMFMRSYISGIDEASYWNTGIGCGIAWNAGGFFLELGIGHTWKIDEYGFRGPNQPFLNAWPMAFQIGYVH